MSAVLDEIMSQRAFNKGKGHISFLLMGQWVDLYTHIIYCSISSSLGYQDYWLTVLVMTRTLTGQTDPIISDQAVVNQATHFTNTKNSCPGLIVDADGIICFRFLDLCSLERAARPFKQKHNGPGKESSLYGWLTNVKHMDNDEKACSTDPKLFPLVSANRISRRNIILIILTGLRIRCLWAWLKQRSVRLSDFLCRDKDTLSLLFFFSFPKIKS